MSRIPDEKVEQVRTSVDIVDLISRYLPLKKSGSAYKALCPFHQEKSPSFHVNPALQIFKCFGCGKGGGVFQFVMEREGTTFPEAVRMLAREAGIDLGEEGWSRGGDGPSPDELYRVLEWACRAFTAWFASPAGEIARDYCDRRKLSRESIESFRLGYAPEGWRNLLHAAGRKGIPEDLLLRAGLARPGKTDDSEPYDWFRNRLMFPIEDVRGRVIGFGARSLDDSEPKYLNSPETAVFHKGRTLYALHRARQAALAAGRMAVVEGYMDAIMAHQAGVAHVVAGLGTGLTRDHAELVSRFARRIDLVYDGDAAGKRAAEKALDVFLSVRAEVRVVELEDGLDPCDVVVQKGPEAFLAALEKGREVFDYLLARAAERHDLATAAGRTGAVDDVLSSVAKAENGVLQDALLARTAEAFKVEERSVRSRLKIFEARGDQIRTGPGNGAASEDFAEPPEDPAERLLLEAALSVPELMVRLAAEWPAERFEHPRYRMIAAAIAEAAAAAERPEAAGVLARLADGKAAGRAADILKNGIGKKELGRQFEDCLGRLKDRRRLEEVQAALVKARADRDDQEIRKLELEQFQLKNRLR